jgi:fatty-acyl-CoA synthase
MRVPLTVNDFLYRAEAVSAQSLAIVDEPVQPATPVRTTTYADLLTRIRAWQAGLMRSESVRASGSPW